MGRGGGVLPAPSLVIRTPSLRPPSGRGSGGRKIPWRFAPDKYYFFLLFFCQFLENQNLKRTFWAFLKPLPIFLSFVQVFFPLEEGFGPPLSPGSVRQASCATHWPRRHHHCFGRVGTIVLTGPFGLHLDTGQSSDAPSPRKATRGSPKSYVAHNEKSL